MLMSQYCLIVQRLNKHYLHNSFYAYIHTWVKIVDSVGPPDSYSNKKIRD